MIQMSLSGNNCWVKSFADLINRVSGGTLFVIQLLLFAPSYNKKKVYEALSENPETSLLFIKNSSFVIN